MKGKWFDQAFDRVAKVPLLQCIVYITSVAIATFECLTVTFAFDWWIE